MVHVSGEIDLSTNAEFDEAMRAGLDTAAAVVILDLSRVAFLGSVGLRGLVKAHNEAQQAGRTMRVVDGTSIVRRVLEISGLDRVLSLYRTLEEARSVSGGL